MFTDVHSKSYFVRDSTCFFRRMQAYTGENISREGEREGERGREREGEGGSLHERVDSVHERVVSLHERATAGRC